MDSNFAYIGTDLGYQPIDVRGWQDAIDSIEYCYPGYIEDLTAAEDAQAMVHDLTKEN